MREKLGSVLIILLLVISGLFIINPFRDDFSTVEAVSEWEQSLDTDFIHGSFDNIAINGSGSNASLQLDNIDGWTKLYPINDPGRCSSSGLAPIYGTQDIILFGGYLDSGQYSSETWQYNYSENKWQERFSSNPPLARENHGMASVWGTDSIIIHGGYGGGLGHFGDTWLYLHNQNFWFDLYPNGTPGPRYSTVMSSIWGVKKVLLFGGSTLSLKGDTWVFDYDDGNWTNKNTSYGPSPRKHHAMTPIPNSDKVMLFGGIIDRIDMNFTYSDETWIYDLSENNWTNVTSEIKPSPRGDHQISTLWRSDLILLYGGNNNDKILDDTWLFDCTNYTWRNINTSDTLEGISSHAMTSLFDTEDMISFGGYDGITATNDTWTFKFPNLPRNGTFISSPFDTQYNSTFTTITWESKNPKDTDVKFKLRTAETEYGLHFKPFFGPDGTKDSYYLSSSTISTTHSGDRWIQYQATLSSSSIYITPELQSITLWFNRWPETKLSEPSNNSFLKNNKPKFSWIFTDLDSHEQTAFQMLIDNDPEFNSVNYDSGKQTSSNHFWQFPDKTQYQKLPEGTWYWKVRVKDRYEAWSYYSSSNQFTIDITNPVSKVNVPINNSFLKYLNTVSGIAYDIDVGSGLMKVEITVKRLNDSKYWNEVNWADEETWLFALGTTRWEYDSVSVPWGSGQYMIQARAWDNATNVEVPEDYIIFAFDSARPISYIENLKDNSFVASLKIIKGTAIDPGNSGINYTKINIKNNDDRTYWDGSAWDTVLTWLVTNGINNWSYDISDVPWKNGFQYTITSRSIDNLSNMEFPGTKTNFTLDTQPPTDLFIYINDGDQYTNDTRVRVTLYSKDEISSVDEMSFSADNMNWSSWERSRDAKFVIFPDDEGDGEKHVYYRVRDSAGNIGGPTTDSIILDTTPPSNLSILTDNYDITANTTKINLELSALDHGSGVNQMSFSLDNQNWSEWEDFRKRITYKIPQNDSDRTISIYFRVIDWTGNTAETVFITINLTSPNIDDDSDNDKQGAENFFASQSTLIIILGFIIIVIISIIFSLIIFRKKRAKIKPKPQLVKTEMVKSHAPPKPEITVDHIENVTLIQKTNQLPSTPTGTNNISATAKKIPVRIPIPQLPGKKIIEDKTQVPKTEEIKTPSEPKKNP